MHVRKAFLPKFLTHEVGLLGIDLQRFDGSRFVRDFVRELSEPRPDLENVSTLDR
jgi:hypothetical protein